MINTYSLVSLADIKNFLGVKGANSEMDDLLSELINRFSIIFENYLCRNILSREYTENHDGGDYHMIFTSHYPITSVSGIWDSSSWVWDDTTLIDSDEYVLTHETGFNAVLFKTKILGDYFNNVRIIYTAGYTEAPEDIQQCLVEEVARSYKGRQEIGVTSKSLGDGSVAYSAEGLLVKTQLVLNRYRRIGV